jgi:uncharacterized protein (DUF488 family)
MTPAFTIGHSNRHWGEFIRLLEENNIGAIADVRRHPGSKSFPQFDKETMAKELMAKSIEYAHIENLGGRRKETARALVVYDNSGWQNRSFKSYADYMTTKPFREGIEELLLLMAKCNGDLAVMCSEAVPWRCHRRLIADYLVMVEGIYVGNIINGGDNRSSRPSPHKLTPFAIGHADGVIIYPKSETM